jgi:hypothetical protein
MKFRRFSSCTICQAAAIYPVCRTEAHSSPDGFNSGLGAKLDSTLHKCNTFDNEPFRALEAEGHLGGVCRRRRSRHYSCDRAIYFFLPPLSVE